MSILDEQNSFRQSKVEVHRGAAYRANVLDGCLVVVTGIPDQWSDNRVSNCQFRFPGGEAMAEKLAAAIVGADPILAAGIRAQLR